MIRLLFLLSLTLAAAASAADTSSRPDRIVSLRVHPATVQLDGSESRRQIVVDGVRADGTVFDLTSAARMGFQGSGAPVVSVDEGKIVRPRRDGSGRLLVRARGLEASVPVRVRNYTRPFRWSFVNHVEAVLSKQGCNMGACHGAGAGKGGLRLSLRAYDPEADYTRLRVEGRGRRIVKTRPAESLLLRKPSLAAPHVGGLLLKQGSLEYRVVRDWIAAGATGPRPSDARLLAIDVFPSERTLRKGERQQLQVTARFSDGRVEDVTHWARYTSNEEPIARVDAGGLVAMRGAGETAVTVAYLDKVAFVRVAVPFNRPAGSASRISRPASVIDRLVDRKLAQLGLQPSGRSTDAEFVRRAYLDVLGTLPTPDETRAFVADSRPNKRARLIDALLERPEYVDFWTYRWADVLRINRDLVGTKGMASLYAWLRESVARNRPWDRIAYDLITASGPAANGPANFYRMGVKPEEFAETVSQTFLGIRVQCAHCHNHPFEKWTQNDYYRMANFFARVKRTEVNGQEVVLSAPEGDIEHPRLKRPLAPAAFDGPSLALNAPGDRRDFLAQWVVSRDNPYFARTIANRIWKQLMGRGLVEPVDDMRLTNPASNEPLLKELTREFTQSGFDAKRLIRQILLSSAYQRSARGTTGNRQDDRFYSRYLTRRIPAEALLDAVCQVTGAPEKFAGIPAGTRAISLPDTRVASDFLDVFGRPARQVTCECERNPEPNMAQALHLITAAGLNGKIASKEGTVARLINSGKADDEVLDELYLLCFSRKPTQSERAAVRTALVPTSAKPSAEAASLREQVFGDVLWALICAPEFAYNH